ncbi:hypothetical protein ACK3BB_16965 [Marinibacterium sp. SX1]
MGQAVLVAGGMLQCSHGGTLRLQSGDARMTAGGMDVVTATMEIGLSFAPGAPGVLVPCPFLSPSSAPSPCAATLAASAGMAQATRIGGQAVLLADARGQATNPNDPGASWSVLDAGQTVVTSS